MEFCKIVEPPIQELAELLGHDIFCGFPVTRALASVAQLALRPISSKWQNWCIQKGMFRTSSIACIIKKVWGIYCVPCDAYLVKWYENGHCLLLVSIHTYTYVGCSSNVRLRKTKITLCFSWGEKDTSCLVTYVRQYFILRYFQNPGFLHSVFPELCPGNPGICIY